MATPWKVILVSAGIALAGAVAFVAIRGEIGPYDLPKQSRELESTLAKSKSLGLPMTKADLDPSEPIPDAMNAAIVVIPTIRDLPSPVVAGDSFLPGADPAKRRDSEKVLADHRQALADIQAGLARPKWYVKRDWDLGPHLIFPEYAKVKSAVKMLSALSVQQAVQGKTDEALATLANGRRLGRHAADDPTLIGMLVAIACDAIMLRAAENLTEVWAKDNGTLDRLATTIEQTNYGLDPRRAWRGEFYLALSYTRNFDLHGGIRGMESLTEGVVPGQPIPVPDPAKLRRDGLPESMTARAMLNPIAETWNAVFAKWPDTVPPSGEWGPYLDKVTKEAAKGDSVSRQLAGVLFPVFAQADLAVVKYELTPQMNVALIRAVQHRNRTGQFPARLSDIGIEIEDRLAGGEVRYKAAGGIVQVWSAGADKVDNGGPLIVTIPNEGKRDIGVVFPSSARRVKSESAA